MRQILCALLLCLFCFQSRADVAYSQPPLGTGALYQSSWWDPDGSDWDVFAWDGFTLPSSQAITEIRWRGGYIHNAMYGGHATNFRVAIWGASVGGSEPDVTHPPLVSYETNGNAGETLAGVFGGVSIYDYHFTLPAVFQAVGGTTYWVYILAYQNGIPDWGLEGASGGNGSHFYRSSEYGFRFWPGDTCFTLVTSGAPTFQISASASPAAGGTIMGAGAYPAGSNASLVANPNAGYGFVNWTENGSQVSTSGTYNFVVTANRTLVAHFVTAYTITTAALPSYAGTASGGGIYNSGRSVTVHATPAAGFDFVEWTEFGTPVSASADYTFIAMANRTLAANFTPSLPSVIFDLDNAPSHTSLPIDVTVGGITAHFSATGSGFSIQRADTMGFTPAGFGGLCIYPNSVFPADLLVSFSQTLTRFSILYSPQELGCDTSATMRVTAYLGTTLVGTSTATAEQPGTWPTGTLSISSVQPFDRVVVHYDARPPTCQDWGPIFLADNMIVAPSACTGASVTLDPASVAACRTASVNFLVAAAGTAPFTFQWERQTTPGMFVALGDGPTGTGSTISGAGTESLTIDSVGAADTGEYRCVIDNSCGSATSGVAALTVCIADFNCDGLISSQDFFDFLTEFFSVAPGADFNGDGAINSQDFFDFLGAFFTGCA